ncbi:G-type lectin S-receptor-like serine/threonine-protein kinase0 [Salvia divinorum]|uniref:G-type lectin S-receptor-like serine/threonine-protein kinase0 n=1 Tax=Salvia divinorum TaxID=28513 RepID=A0ABD1IEE2_SALDI
MQLIDDADLGVEKYLTSWRNVDDPSPGDYILRIENKGLLDVVTLRGTTKRYRMGKWNGLYFCGGPRLPNAMYNVSVVFRQERMISVEDAYNSTTVIRTTLDPFGTLTRLTLNAKRDKSYRAYTFPQDTCNEYGVCGPNGICKSRTDSPVRCQCFKGFSPKFQYYWDLQDWSGGCTRTKLLNCHGGDGFLEVGGVKYPDMLSFWLNRNMSLSECNAECLKNCSCTAYANPFITNGGSGFLMWFNELIDTKELSTADSKQNIYIRVPVSELDLSRSLEDEKENKRCTFIGKTKEAS